MADIVVKTHNGNETYTGIESVTFNTTQEGVKATFIAQKQADWLQDDETAVDYIKNKPFYENGDTVVKLDNKYLNILEEENVNENIILAEQNIADFTYNTTFGAFWTIRYSILAELVEGQEYTILWDGTEYVRTAFAFTNPTDGTSCIAVGNKMVSTGVDDRDLFAIVNDTINNHTHLFSTENKTEHSVAIYQTAAATYKINKTYLPDDIGKQSDWNQTDDTAVDFIKNKPEGLATETYVQEQIAAIDFPEVSEQVQADWNENDETSKAFVQNRPFYVLGDWVKETTGTFALDKYAKNNIRSSAIQCGSLPAEGEVFKVIWDGTEYECIMTFYQVANAISVGVIGNPKILAEYYGNQVVPPDTGEPFCFSYGFKTVYTRSTAASHTFQVYYKDSVVKLDEKFIPASVKLPSVTTDDNGKALIVTNGEWIASELEDETQSDWNETDETSKAFILNKPEIPSIEGLATEDFVKEQIAAIEIPEGGGSSGGGASNEKVFLEETEIENLFNLDGLIGAQIPFTDYLNIGETYYVNWNGVEYEVTNAQDATALMQNLIDPRITKAVAMGNGETFGLSGNNEPFTIITVDEVIMFADLSPEAAIGGKNIVRIYQKTPLTVSWENVTDKPFVKENKRIFVDHSKVDTSIAFTSAELNATFVRLTEETFTKDELIGATITATFASGDKMSNIVSESNIQSEDNNGLTIMFAEGLPIAVFYKAGQYTANMFGVETTVQIPKAGIYTVDRAVVESESSEIVTNAVAEYLDNKCLSILENKTKLTEFIAKTEFTNELYRIGDQQAFASFIPLEQTMFEKWMANKTQVVVKYDEVEYELTPQAIVFDGDTSVCVGNLVPFGGAGNNETFAIAAYWPSDGAGGVVYGLLCGSLVDQGPTEHSVAIYLQEDAYKIKEEYLPDSTQIPDDIATKSYVQEKIESIKVPEAGLTTAQVLALDNLFKIIAYTNDATEEYEAFVQAFGLRITTTSISLDLDQLNLMVGDKQTLVATVTPSNAMDEVIWSTSNSSVATVSNGVVTAVSDGDCVITVQSGNHTASCNVTCKWGELVAELSQNDLVIGGLSSNYKGTAFASTGTPYMNTRTNRLSYVKFDIPAAPNYQYKFVYEADSSIRDIGVEIFNSRALQKVNNSQNFLDADRQDAGWLSNGATVTPNQSQNGYPPAAIRLTFRKNGSANSNVDGTEITKVRIYRRAIS